MLKIPTAFTKIFFYKILNCTHAKLFHFTVLPKVCSYISFTPTWFNHWHKTRKTKYCRYIKKIILKNNTFIRNIFYNFFKKNSTLSWTCRETSFCLGLLESECTSLLSLSISSYSTRDTLPAVSSISTGTISCGRGCSVLLHMALDFWDSARLLVTS